MEESGPAELTAFICVTCGSQHSPSAQPPAECAICTDERQYVGHGGQRWTTLAELRREHRADIREEEPGLTGIGSTPSFAIGQRALLVQTEAGNVLWDCLAPFDEEVAAAVRQRGGIDAIAISHPHFYTTMVEWSRAFEAPIHLHAADRRWVMRPDAAIDFWDGERLDLFGGLTLLRLGGHFAGGTVLHWAAGAEGRGALLSGDIVQAMPTPAGSASCAPTRTSSPCPPPPSRGSSRRSSRGPSTAFTPPGSGASSTPTPPLRCAARPTATSARSPRGSSTDEFALLLAMR
jgi:Metallo-beta-lactamase superfamily